MVTFDIDTDGQQSPEEITRLLKDMLNSGNFDGYRVSPDGFSLVKVRGKQSLIFLAYAFTKVEEKILVSPWLSVSMDICTGTQMEMAQTLKSGLQIRRSNKDNLGIIIKISS